MQKTIIGNNSVVLKSIIDEDVVVGPKAYIGGAPDITVIGQGVIIKPGLVIEKDVWTEPETENGVFSA